MFWRLLLHVTSPSLAFVSLSVFGCCWDIKKGRWGGIGGRADKRLVSFDRRSANDGFLDQVGLTSGNGGRGDKGAVLGADHVQVAFGDFGTFFGDFQFTLDAAGTGDRLSWEALLKVNQKLVTLIKKSINESSTCSDNWRLYCASLELALSSCSCNKMTFLWSSSHWTTISLTVRSFFLKILMVSAWFFFSESNSSSMSRMRDSNLEMARLAPTTALASTSSRRTERFCWMELLVNWRWDEEQQRTYLDFDFQRLLDSFNLDDAFLFFVEEFDGMFKLHLQWYQSYSIFIKSHF